MTVDPFFAVGLCGVLVLFISMVIRSFKRDIVAVNHDTAAAPLERRHLGEIGTPPISEETERRIALLFAPQDQQIVLTVLRDECGTNLPGLYNPEHGDIERIRFAVLKLSNGRLDKLEKAVEAAKIDWRDVLYWAGFGRPGKHKSWLPRSRTEPTGLSRLLSWWGGKR